MAVGDGRHKLHGVVGGGRFLEVVPGAGAALHLLALAVDLLQNELSYFFENLKS